MITADTLKAFAPNCRNPAVHAAALEVARQASTVTTERRLAHFLGQVFVETGGFTALEENFNYRDPCRLDAIFSAVKGADDAKALIGRGAQAIASRVYACRIGNGDEASGDGWAFRGSGYLQITGRGNFARVGQQCGIDLCSDPDLAREPATAARLAFRFWDAHGLSDRADDGDVEAITRTINGPAMLGLRERREAVIRATHVWTPMAAAA